MYVHGIVSLHLGLTQIEQAQDCSLFGNMNKPFWSCRQTNVDVWKKPTAVHNFGTYYQILVHMTSAHAQPSAHCLEGRVSRKQRDLFQKPVFSYILWSLPLWRNAFWFFPWATENPKCLHLRQPFSSRVAVINVSVVGFGGDVNMKIMKGYYLMKESVFELNNC